MRFQVSAEHPQHLCSIEFTWLFLPGRSVHNTGPWLRVQAGSLHFHDVLCLGSFTSDYGHLRASFSVVNCAMTSTHDFSVHQEVAFEASLFLPGLKTEEENSPFLPVLTGVTL